MRPFWAWTWLELPLLEIKQFLSAQYMQQNNCWTANTSAQLSLVYCPYCIARISSKLLFEAGTLSTAAGARFGATATHCLCSFKFESRLSSTWPNTEPVCQADSGARSARVSLANIQLAASNSLQGLDQSAGRTAREHVCTKIIPVIVPKSFPVFIWNLDPFG